MPRSTALKPSAGPPPDSFIRSVVSHPSPARPIVGGDIERWLVAEGRMIEHLAQMFDELCWRLVGDGVPLWRATLNLETLHPQILGVTCRWWRTRGITEEISYAHGIAQAESYLTSPIFLVSERGETVRRRIACDAPSYEFPVLAELGALGATDYLAAPLTMLDGQHFPSSWVTDAPEGFSEPEIQRLLALTPALAAVVDAKATRRMATDLLETYLGPHVGQRVLSGQIRRGEGERIFAVLWYSDLRRSTALADRLSGDEFFSLLNDYFDCTAGAVLDHGGEVLRFVGDAVLGVFEIVEPETSISGACRRAYQAACAALSRRTDLNHRRRERDEPTVDFGIGLHYGEVMYGNIGVPTRLEFSVIGSAANETSRIEGLCKRIGQPLLVSKRFAQEVDAPWISMGTHDLRGIAQLIEIFALAPEYEDGAGAGI